VFTPFVVVVGGKYFWPGAKMPIFNLMVCHFLFAKLIEQMAHEYKCRTKGVRHLYFNDIQFSDRIFFKMYSFTLGINSAFVCP
jgi:hypothetical protein